MDFRVLRLANFDIVGTHVVNRTALDVCLSTRIVPAVKNTVERSFHSCCSHPVCAVYLAIQIEFIHTVCMCHP